MDDLQKERYGIYSSLIFAFVLLGITALTIRYCIKNRAIEQIVSMGQIVSYKSLPNSHWVGGNERQYRVITSPSEDSYLTLPINRASYIKLCNLYDLARLRKIPKDTTLIFRKPKDSQIYKLK